LLGDSGDVLFFGGSSAEMFDDAWILSRSNERAWEWNEVAVSGEMPQARVGAVCFPVGTRGMCVFGGAEATPTGLNLLDDLWHLEFEKSGAEYKGVWTRIEPDGDRPPPRNAACLTKIDDSKFLLCSGWGLFVESYDDVREIVVKK